MNWNKLAIAAVSVLMLATSGMAQMRAEPTAEHKVVAADVGTWDCEMKIWMAGPDADPMVVKGTEVNEMFGPYWLISKFKADMGGQNFEGRASLGYDPSKKKFVGTWFDTMNPFMSHMEGTYDKETKTMTMMTTGVGPDGKPSKGKNVSVSKEDGTRVFTMFSAMPGDDKNFIKAMEIVYKKR